MAKIVGRDEKAVKQVTCRNCAARIEYTASETTSHVHHDYGGGSDTYYYLKCPKCSEDINLGSRSP